MLAKIGRTGLLVGSVLTTFGCGSGTSDAIGGTGGGIPFTTGTAGQTTASGGGGPSVTPGGPISQGSGGVPTPQGGLGATPPPTSKGSGGSSAGGVPVSNGTGGATVVGGAGGAPGEGGATANGGSSGGAAVGGAGGNGPHGACLDGITNYGMDGPFKMTTKTVGVINYYVPGVPADCKVPVVHLANGTGATCSVYLPSLQRLATHGFLAACYENANTGNGDQGLQALDTALMTFPDLADNKFGSTGHSQGGMAAFTVLARAEKKYGTKMIYAGLAMEPASGFGSSPVDEPWQQMYADIKSPMFMFSGLGTDGLVAQTWVQQAYDATSKTEEAYFWTAAGATHIPVPNGQEEEISIPWFRWKLLGDKAACEFFKKMPDGKKWEEKAKQNVAACK